MSKDYGQRAREIARRASTRIAGFISTRIGLFRYVPAYVKAVCKQWSSILFGESLLAVLFMVWWAVGQPPLSVVFSIAVLVAGFFVWCGEFLKSAKPRIQGKTVWVVPDQDGVSDCRCVFLVSIKNRGEPTIADDWKVTVTLADGKSLDGQIEDFEVVNIFPANVDQAKATRLNEFRSIKREEMILKKVARDPISKGAKVDGYIIVKFPVISGELAVVGTEYHFSFADIDDIRHTFSHKVVENAVQFPPSYRAPEEL